MNQQNHKACTRSSSQLMVENPGNWREEPQQITRLLQDGIPQLMVENPGKWQEGPQQITRLVQDGLTQLMVENPGKWLEGPQQITRLVQDGPPQLMVENPGKWREGLHWFLRTTNKTAPLGATKYWGKNTNHFFLYYCFLSLIPSILFCFVSPIMGVDLYTSFQKYRCFWLENGGRLIHESTYTRENIVVNFMPNHGWYPKGPWVDKIYKLTVRL